jgi:hypothetical protein
VNLAAPAADLGNHHALAPLPVDAFLAAGDRLPSGAKFNPAVGPDAERLSARGAHHAVLPKRLGFFPDVVIPPLVGHAPILRLIHDCPACGGLCSCDSEDHHQAPPADCQHECPSDDDFDDEEFLDDPEDQ